MRSLRKRRLYFVVSLLIGVSIAIGLALFALRQNINLYYTPTQLLKQNLHRVVRLGGFVLKGSIRHQKKALRVSFIVTDFRHAMRVEYEGILPSLFREGQGIVAQGHVNNRGIFIADQVLAKHDANYHPSSNEVKE